MNEEAKIQLKEVINALNNFGVNTIIQGKFLPEVREELYRLEKRFFISSYKDYFRVINKD